MTLIEISPHDRHRDLLRICHHYRRHQPVGVGIFVTRSNKETFKSYYFSRDHFRHHRYLSL